MTKISIVKEAVRICKDSDVTMFLWGDRGLGKSSIVQQVAATNGWGFIDLRASQMEASDIRGLPDKGEDGRTHFLPPADMPIGDMTFDQIQAELGVAPEEGDLEGERVYCKKLQELQPHFQHGILFLDELNRAADDVLQSAFQLVLDRRVGQYVLPPGWTIVAAGNFMEGYVVSGFSDAAFLNRFCHVILSGGDATLEEWIDFMGTVHGANAAAVIEFASQNVKHLDGDIKGEMGFSIQPSRRSWEKVVKVEQACRNATYSEAARLEVIAGLVGRELALTYTRYNCPVKPQELLKNGVKRYEKDLRSLERNQQIGLMWGLIACCKDKVNEEKVSTVCLDFAHFLLTNMKDKDVVVAFCKALVSNEGIGLKDREKAAIIANPKFAQMVAKFRQKSQKGRTFLDALNERPEFQSILSRVSLGIGDDDEKI